MSVDKDGKSRRHFLSVAMSTAGGVAVGVSLGDQQNPRAHVVEINAMAPTPEQQQALLALPARPVVMVNLLKFKPNGGADEYAKYVSSVRPLLQRLGAKILFSSQAAACLIGNADWDAIGLVEYPTPATLVQMATSQDYQAISHHREAGLAGQVNYAVFENPESQ